MAHLKDIMILVLSLCLIFIFSKLLILEQKLELSNSLNISLEKQNAALEIAKISAQRLGAVVENQLSIVENQSMLYGIPFNYIIIGLGLVSVIMFSYYFNTGGSLVQKLTNQSIINTENMAIEVIKANDKVVKSIIMQEGPLMSSIADQYTQVNTMTNYLHGLITKKVLELSVQIEILSSNLYPVVNSDLAATIPNIISIGDVADLIL